ncbi:MAG TPA: alpha-L-fucosidase [Candidatus Didemnitutus sp.]
MSLDSAGRNSTPAGLLAPVIRRGILAAGCLCLLFVARVSAADAGPPPLDAAQRDFMTWRFGMFVHFHLGTYADLDWAGGYEDPALFNPRRLNCGEWADEAKAAGMTYMVFTVKHTEGMTLYDSALTTHDSTKFRNFRDGKSDIVREFVDACRSRGLKVGLYYCFPGDYSDVAHHNAPPPGQPDLHGLPPEARGDYSGFMKKQLREMLARYGPVDLLWIDQWDNKYTVAQWPEIFAYLKKLQPNLIVIGNNAHRLQDSDVLSYEYSWLQEMPPEANQVPAEVCDPIQKKARWFWTPGEAPDDLQPAAEVVQRLRNCNARHANYLLDVPPDRDGLISGVHLQRLREIGALLRAGQR